MTEYCERTDGRLSYDLAIAECRERFLAERLPGENAREYRARVRATCAENQTDPSCLSRQVAE